MSPLGGGANFPFPGSPFRLYEVGSGLRPDIAWPRFGRHSANGRDAVAPLPASGARERVEETPHSGGHQRPQAAAQRARSDRPPFNQSTSQRVLFPEKGDREGCVTEGRKTSRYPLSAKRLSERGQAPSRERDEARPQQARLGWHAVPTLPETRGRRTARGAVPT